MKQLYKALLVSFISLICISTKIYAGTATGHMTVSIQVSCYCDVNGVIVPITEGACLPACQQLQKANNTSEVMVTQNGDTKTVVY